MDSCKTSPKPTPLPSGEFKLPKVKLAYSEIQMHFNEFIALNQVEFKRNEEGIYKHTPAPYHIPFNEVSSYGDGWVSFGGNTVLVEEDAATIARLIDEKKSAKHAYDQARRLEDRMGVVIEEGE
jgi:hypothetical protein